MSIFSKLKPQKIVDSVFSGVDKAILTKEEMIDYTNKAVEQNIEFVKLTMQESTPRSISRRIIAILVIGSFVVSFFSGLFGLITGWYEGKVILELTNDTFDWAVISIIVFYFGNHMINNLLPKFAEKKLNKK